MSAFISPIIAPARPSRATLQSRPCSRNDNLNAAKARHRRAAFYCNRGTTAYPRPDRISVGCGPTPLIMTLPCAVRGFACSPGPASPALSGHGTGGRNQIVIWEEFRFPPLKAAHARSASVALLPLRARRSRKTTDARLVDHARGGAVSVADDRSCCKYNSLQVNQGQAFSRAMRFSITS